MPEERYQNTFSISGLDKLQSIRHFTQIVVFVFLNAKAIGLLSSAIVVPYLHSTQAPFSAVHGAFDALEYTLAKGLVPLFVLGVIYLTAITVGRLYCGWACPLGAVQDFLVYLPVKKLRLSNKTIDTIRDIKWAFLGFSILTATLVGMKRTADIPSPLGVFSDSPFSVLSPASTLFTYIPWMVIWKSGVIISGGTLTWLKLLLLGTVLALSALIPRFFCRYVCPLGALFEPVSKYKLLRIYRASTFVKDELNKLLVDICPMGVQVQNDENNFIDHPACIHCGRCVVESPRKLSQEAESL